MKSSFIWKKIQVFMGVAKNVVKGQEYTQVAIKKLHDKSGIHKR